jgi:putative FmdB family regulatory protein
MSVLRMSRKLHNDVFRMTTQNRQDTAPMPAYAFRCKECGNEFEAFFRSYSAYDEATITCPACQSDELTRVINRVQVAGHKSHDYAKMSSREMLSVLESGNSDEVNTLFDQVRGANPADAAPHQQTLKQQTKKSSADTD